MDFLSVERHSLIKFSCKVLTVLFAFTFAHKALAQSESENFELTITGALVEKLEPNTRITVGTIGTSKEYPCVTMSTNVDSLPLYLPKKHFQNRYLRVSFYSHSQKASIFSMEIDASLMGKVRPIKLPLDQPSPNMRTTVGWDQVRYKPSVTKRIAYMDLPCWDGGIGKLVPAPKKPVLRVDNGEGKTTSIEMRHVCMGDKWHAKLPRDFAPAGDAKISYTVDYDSGGLFDSVSTNFQYDYRVGIDTN